MEDESGIDLTQGGKGFAQQMLFSLYIVHTGAGRKEEGEEEKEMAISDKEEEEKKISLYNMYTDARPEREKRIFSFFEMASYYFNQDHLHRTEHNRRSCNNQPV